MREISQREFRDAMGQFCTGVVVVTGLCDGVPVGFTAQSFVSVSLAPPLIAVCPAHTSLSWPLLRKARRFGINVLGLDQRELCLRFARTGEAKFAGQPWRLSRLGTPVLEGVIGHIDCELVAEHPAGDHTLVVARVLDLDISNPQAPPLLFLRGRYGAFTDLGEAGPETLDL